MRGGAVVFGPVVRDHGYSLQKKVRSVGLKMALSLKLSDSRLFVLDTVKVDKYNTAVIADKLKGLNVEKPLFVTGKNESDFFSASVRNLVYTDVLPPEGVNVYDVLRHKNLLITMDGLKGLLDRFA